MAANLAKEPSPRIVERLDLSNPKGRISGVATSKSPLQLRSPNLFNTELELKEKTNEKDKTSNSYISRKAKEEADTYSDIYLKGKTLPRNSSFEKLQRSGRLQGQNIVSSNTQQNGYQIDIRVEDFFLEGNSSKVLHFFQPKTKNFFFVDLDEIGTQPRNVVVNLTTRFNSRRLN